MSSAAMLYGSKKLDRNPGAQVLIFDSAKDADQAQDRYVAAGIGVDRLSTVAVIGDVAGTEWEPLKGRAVVLWPAANDVGKEVMLHIGDVIEATSKSLKVVVSPEGTPGDLPKGTDIMEFTKAHVMPLEEYRRRIVGGVVVDPEPSSSKQQAAVDVPVLEACERPAAQVLARQVAQVVVGSAADVAHEGTQHATRASSDLDDVQDRAAGDDDLALGAGFLILGYDRDVLFIYSRERQQVITTSVQKLSREAGLIELADLQWWEMCFSEPGKGLNPKMAANWVTRIAGRRGVYDADRVRGRGAWYDDGHLVFHLGNRLIIDGKLSEIGSLQSRFVYEARPALRTPNPAPLSAREGADLLRISKMFRWENVGAADLLMGWLFLAPICGLLKWRPHIWIGAAPGAGKSTLMNNFIRPLLPDRWALHEQGLSTEAALRQKLVADARPVLLDEFEANTEADRRRIEGVLTLIRLSSSSGEISRGTVAGRAITFTARSMFCLASVGVGLHRQTDEDRITRLELTKNGGSADQWDKLEVELLRIGQDDNLGQRLFARALDRLAMIRQTVELFTKEAGAHFKSQRHGDQYGTLLAGCWCLTNDCLPSVHEVQERLRSNEWGELGAGTSAGCDDSTEALNALLCASIRLDGGKTMAVSQLIEVASITGTAESTTAGPLDVKRKEADHQLQLHGIRVKAPEGKDCEGEVLFAMAHRQLTSLVADSDFATDLHGRLARLPGARKSREGQPKAKIRFAGAALRYVSVPLRLCVSKDDDEQMVSAPTATMPKQDHNDYQNGQPF